MESLTGKRGIIMAGTTPSPLPVTGLTAVTVTAFLRALPQVQERGNPVILQ